MVPRRLVDGLGGEQIQLNLLVTTYNSTKWSENYEDQWTMARNKQDQTTSVVVRVDSRYFTKRDAARIEELYLL